MWTVFGLKVPIDSLSHYYALDEWSLPRGTVYHDSSDSTFAPSTVAPPLFADGKKSFLASFTVFSQVSERVFDYSPVQQELPLSTFGRTFLVNSVTYGTALDYAASHKRVHPATTFRAVHSGSPVEYDFSSVGSLGSNLQGGCSAASEHSLANFSSFGKGAARHFDEQTPVKLVIQSVASDELIPPSFVLPVDSGLHAIGLSDHAWQSSSVQRERIV